jgi:uncharacterized iron-regulated membrane protein
MREITKKVHFWLGIITGPIVFVIGVTGAIYALQEEIQNATQAFRFVPVQSKKQLPPSALITSSDKLNPGRDVHAVMYQDKGKSAKVIYYNYKKHYYDFVYINPYSGDVLEVHDVNNSFFAWILSGHFNLWLPPEIGVPLVATSTLIFTLIVLSGLVLWWPRNKKNKSQKFKIKRKTKWRRKNYDLHSVVGFYSLLLALILGMTGLVWGFNWFRDMIYSAASGGKEYVEYSEPPSQIATETTSIPIDRAWNKMNKIYPNAEWIEVHIPHDSVHCIAVNANPDATTFWKTNYLYFDQKTLETKPVKHQYGQLDDASFANKLMRMNYDIHVGGILGLPGKIMMCLFSLLIASLPITGFLIWYGRKYKNPNK